MSGPADILSKRADILSERADILSERTDILSEQADILSERADILSESQNVLSTRPDKISRRPNLLSAAKKLLSDEIEHAQKLALTRKALLAVIPFDEKRNLASLIAHNPQNPKLAIDLILHACPQIWTFQPNALQRAGECGRVRVTAATCGWKS